MDNQIKKNRPIEKGDVLFRYLPEYQVWHTGIVIEVESQNWYQISVMEFDDSHTISINNLRQYLWDRKFFWISSFMNERIKYGDTIFRTKEERVATAWKLYHENSLKYTLHKYNCEYFTRRCVFKEEKYWPSTQTVVLGENRLLFYLKLASVFLFGVMHNINLNKNFERSMRSSDHKYTCENNYVVYLGTK